MTDIDKSLSKEWYVIRQDTHGNKFLYATKQKEAEAETIAKRENDKGHHQGYWVTKILPDDLKM